MNNRDTFYPSLLGDIRRTANDIVAGLDETGVYKKGFYHGFTTQPPRGGRYTYIADRTWTAGRNAGTAARREWDKLAWNA